jgi:hypothetical protein
MKSAAGRKPAGCPDIDATAAPPRSTCCACRQPTAVMGFTRSRRVAVDAGKTRDESGFSKSSPRLARHVLLLFDANASRCLRTPLERRCRRSRHSHKPVRFENHNDSPSCRKVAETPKARCSSLHRVFIVAPRRLLHASLAILAGSARWRGALQHFTQPRARARGLQRRWLTIHPASLRMAAGYAL